MLIAADTPHPPRGLRPLGTLSRKGRGEARTLRGFAMLPKLENSVPAR